jgi:lysozyme
MNREALIADLTRDEGCRLKVYDDATGQPLKPGVTIKGHPTIGIGRALDVNGIHLAEATAMLNTDIDFLVPVLSQQHWFAALDDLRQNAVLNMAFNLGIAGLLEFHDMIRYLGDHRYELAARAMESSTWYHQVGPRAVRLVAAIRGATATS